MARNALTVLLLLSAACASVASRQGQPASAPVPPVTVVKAFYFGHSLLAGAQASPNYHIPYDVGVFAAAKGHAYETHGQLGWGTSIAAHWAWNSDELAQGPLGFARENHAPFYAGRNGKAELASGAYNVVVFTDVNGNARGADQAPTVAAIVGFIQLARTHNPDALAVLYSCWNELPVEQQSDRAAVQKWRDATLSELAWWESVAQAVQAVVGAERMLLVPVSALIAELALDAADGRMGASLSARSFFIDDVHGTPMTYYAAAAALYTAIFRDSPLAATTDIVHANVSGAIVAYRLPSARAAQHIQQRAFEMIRNYPRAGFARPARSSP
jgi:hypothetical protein